MTIRRLAEINGAAVMTIVALILTLSEWMANMPQSMVAWVLSAGHVVALTLIPVFPVPAGSLVIFIFCCGSLIPYQTGVSQYWGVWVTLGVLGYYRFRKNGLLMTLAATVVCWLSLALFHLENASVYGSAMMSCSFAFAWCIGGMFHREVAVNRELEALNQERLRYQREKRVAAEIHDAVSGQLSYAILLSQRTDKTPQAVIAGMRDASVKAMNSLYQIIDYLNGESEQNRAGNDFSKESGQKPYDRLETMIRREERRLASIGFAGRVAIRGEANYISTEGEKCLSGLLRELFANIMRHGEPNRPYYLSIVFSLHEITVVQSNTPRKGGSAIPASRGYGLASVKQRISNRGGTVRRVLEDGSWTLYASIPQ